MQKSKRNEAISKSVDVNKEYSLKEAIDTIKKNSKVKFVETLDCAIRLGVDPRHADQMIRGTVSLPNGTGKEVRVLVVCKGAKAQEALDAGADYAGFEEYLEKINIDNLEEMSKRDKSEAGLLEEILEKAELKNERLIDKLKKLL